MASQDGFEAVTQKFLEWLPTMGITMSPKMQIADLRSEGRGRGVGKFPLYDVYCLPLGQIIHCGFSCLLFYGCTRLCANQCLVATGDFEEDEVIFSIPRRSVINLKYTTDTYDVANIHASVPDLPPWLVHPPIYPTMHSTQLTLSQSLTAILVGQSDQVTSRHLPYFGVLPQHLDTLVFWSDSELDELQASTVVNKIGKAGAEEQFNKHLTPVGFDMDACHRAASIIMAYAFDIPDEDADKVFGSLDEDELESDDEENEKTILSMVPLADMLNADADRNNARLFYDAKDLEMRTIKPIAKGEEIFNDYGQLPRADLLRRYGYATDNYAPFDVAEISTQSILDRFTGPALQELDPSLQPLTQAQLKRRLEIAEREGVYEDSFDVFHASADQTAISDEFAAFIFLLLASKETFDAIHSSQIAIPSRSKLTTELAGKVFVAILKAKLAEYATTAVEDEAILQEQNLPYRKKVAVQVRLGEKKVLQGAILEAETFQRNNKQMRVAQEEEEEKSNGKRKAEHQSSNARKKGRK